MIPFIKDVVVFVWVLGKDVNLTSMHVTEIGKKASGVETHPESEAIVKRACRVAHYGDIGERRQVRVLSDGVAGTWVLAVGIGLVVSGALTAPEEIHKFRTLCADVSFKGRDWAAANGGESGQRYHGGENVN